MKAAQAAQVAELLPKATAKTVLGLSRSVRLFTEAHERSFAVRALDEIDELAQTFEEEQAPLQLMLRRQTTAVRKALNFNERKA